MTGIVILNFRTWNLSVRCIRSIKDGEYRIYLVDNASPNRPTKEEEEELSARSDVIRLQVPENKGYSAGNNIGIRAALKDGCDAVIIANSDIVFGADSIDVMIKDLSEGKRIGIVGPKVIERHGNIQWSRIAIRTGIKEKFKFYTGLKYLFVKDRRRYYALDVPADQRQYVYHVLGCCFAMSSSCAKDVTPFDENTFLYEEELILGIRMEQRGWRTMYEPKAVVKHMHGATTDTVKPFAYQCIAQSEQYYMDTYLHAKKWQLMLMRTYRRFMYDLHCIRDKDFREYRKEFRKGGRQTGA